MKSELDGASSSDGSDSQLSSMLGASDKSSSQQSFSSESGDELTEDDI